MGTRRRIARPAHILFGLALASLTTATFSTGYIDQPARAQQPPTSAAIPVIAPGSAYRQTNLISDSPGLAPVLDPLLVNPWGIALTASSPFWVANAGTSTSTLYRGDVGGAPIVPNPGLGFINIPPTPPPPPGALPTGTVANTTNDFVVTSGSGSGAARFLFATITGKIMGWNPNVPAAGSITAVEAASQPGHVYTGLAIGNNGSGNFLYAADIANNNIDVFNSSFTLQPEASFPFTDPTVGPLALPAGYHVHNIQALGGELYVTYAKMNPAPPDPSNPYLRPGGAVNVFNFNGVFLRRIHLSNPLDAISPDPLSAPWGLALAPASFGVFSDALLVGNFTFEDGDGRISAFNKTTGAFLGQLQDESGTPTSIDGLWALQFGNGGNGGDPNTLYFAAGIGHEQHGLFGKLNPTTATATNLIQFSTDEYAIGEGALLTHIDVTVTRSGNVSQAASVNFNTFDQSQPGHASQKSDYQIALGKLDFAPGETSKTFRVLLVPDLFDETDEIIELMLSNPTGAGVGLGSPNTATVTILDNDTGAPTTNLIDDTTFFVRQHYLDFLNREPDPPGLGFWANEIDSCAGNAQCREVKRVNVSAAFFLSIEFQNTGYLAYRTHRAAFGETTFELPVPILYGNFIRDTQALQRGFVFGQPGALDVLEANKVTYFNEFVTRPEFVSKYPATLTNEQYVDNLLASAGLSPSQVRLFVVNMTNAQENPPANPTSSGGGARPASFGTARLQFNSGQTALTITGTVNNIDFTGSQSPAEANDNLTAAHIHASSTLTPATNAGVVFGFIGTPFNDNNPNDAVVTPFASGVGGNFRAKWDVPEGNGTTLAAQLANLREGRAYLNFHTTQFGGGEIRGNIPAAAAFRDALIAGLNAATETRATVLRKIAEAEELQAREFNAAFVAMQYFGYLRRDPDASGFNFWLNKLNAFNGNFQDAEMVKAFLTSLEYRQRFGP
jgi:uncharacterized protein (TIGR03118 family)